MALCALGMAGTASAQLFVTEPDFKPGPIAPEDPLVGRPIPGAGAAENRALIIWNLRAGLNVAALQCQFSPYFRAAPLYNGILAQHSVELANAYQTIDKYFIKVAGPAKGPRMFDDYTTSTYNNWSTLQAQLGFCQTASNVMRGALATPKGQFYQFAANHLRELRNSLVPMTDAAIVYNPWVVRVSASFPQLDPNCYDKKDRLRRQCGGDAR